MGAANRLQVQWLGCSMRAAAVALVAALWATPAGAQGLGGSPFPLEDLLQIVVLERDLLALDAQGGGDTREALELGENVLWTQSRGRVGVALTDRRILAVGTGSAAWQRERYLRTESRPHSALLGDQVALILTDKRALGFDGRSGNLIEASIGPREKVVASRVSANVVTVITNRRALALSPFAGGFFDFPLRVGEDIESIDMAANLATIRTSQRLLTFRAPTGQWSERRLDLR